MAELKSIPAADLVKRLRDYEQSGLGAISPYEAGDIADAMEEQSIALESYRNRMRAGNDWIPVTERLPKDEKDVLAYYGFRHDGELSSQRFIGTLAYFAFDPNPHWQHEGQGFLQVTHWMPLPEAPT